MQLAFFQCGKHFVRSAVLLAVVGCSVRCSAQTYSERVLADNPFAYWRLDETSGATAINAGTSTAESATYAGPLELGVPGLLPGDLADPDNRAVRLLGYDNEDTFAGGKVDVADSPLTNAGGPYVEKTIEFWFSAEKVDTLDEQILYEQGGSTRGMVMYIRQGEVFVGAHNSADDDGSLATPWIGGTGAERELAFVSTSIEANTPYHLAMVMEGDADGFEGTIRGYLNGELFGEVGGVGSLFSHTDDSAVGGLRAQTLFDNGLLGDEATEVHFFEGVIDEFALYDRALPAGRIAIHFGVDPSADINGDGTVDLNDFAILSGNFNTPGEFSDGDVNFDQMVNMTDFVLWRNLFLGQGAAAVPVPEPAAGSLIAIGVLTMLALRRRPGA
jgi:hypothetical protein